MSRKLTHPGREVPTFIEPVHPGLVLRDYLDHYQISGRELARRCRVAATTVTNILRARSAVSPEMALRLGCVFRRPPRFWLELQLNHELADATRCFSIYVARECQPLDEPAQGKRA